MAKPSTPMLISKNSQEGLVEFAKQCQTLMQSQWNIRDQMRKIDLAYIREEDQSEEHRRAQLANRYGDRTRLQNITVPVVMPQVEAAVTYQASVFLTGNPIFGVVSNPASIDAALQLETVIDNQAVMGGWVRQLILALRDGFKYNLMGVECSWESVTVASLETDLSFSTSQARPKETLWTGNKLRRLDLYNTFFDTRIAPSEVHKKGDFAGYTELMSRIQLKSYIASLDNHLIDNVKAAFESGIGHAGTSPSSSDFYTPDVNPAALTSQTNRLGMNWMAWAGVTGADGNNIQYKDMYYVTTIYARILPSDFLMSVPARNTPQIWKLVIVNNQVVIYCERQTNAHNYLPMLFAQPLEDGLNFQTKPLAVNVMPIQDITSAMWNSAIAARRRAVSDRGIYDPSRIAPHHINSDNPSAKIPVRPAAYGKAMQEAYFPIPFRDDQSGIILQETNQLMQMANLISGQNPARQGQFVKGNKTRDEFQTVMANANGRDQLTAMVLESQFFTPLKEIIKINILQYQGAETLYNRDQQTEVTIDPIALRKTVMEFKISDGLTPSDKLINAEAFQAAMQVISSNAQVNGEYNLGPLFSYLMKTQGADLRPFEKTPEQIAYERAVQQWQQVVLQAMKQNPEIRQEQLPPQPTPQQFNYDPNNKMPGAADSNAPQIRNYTNNIQNNVAERPM